MTMSKKSNIPPGLTLRQTLLGHEKVINRIAWSPDGKILASPSSDKTIRIWDIQMRQQLHVLIGHTDEVNAVAWSPDGSVLASCSDDKTIRFWNLQTGKCLRTLTGHTDSVLGVAWSPDGRILASSSGSFHTVDKTI